jgi:hypothetical protein
MGGSRIPSGLRGLAAAAVLALSPLAAAANEQAYNPRPASDDVILPMPGGYKMVFARVPVPGSGHWGAADRIFEMGGDPKRPEPFEVARSVRIGGNFRNAAGKWYLAFGKYEVSIGQYAAVMGEGDLAKGLALAAELSGIEEVKSAAEAGGAGARWLARPLHGLSIHDYHDFIARYNVWCLANADCIAAMKRELGIVGFFRLPTELEWEYVARGGETGIRQTAVFPFAQGEIASFDEIGKRSALPGLPIYDIYGNVAELMANPFTMDNGSGSVGAGVIRGGDYTTPAARLRFSYREELALFRLRASDNTYVKSRNKLVGIRMMIGTLVKEIDDRGQKLREIEQEFRCCYRPILGRAGSARQARIAGRTLASAKDLGALPARREIELDDGVDAEQTAGYFSFRLDQFGSFKLSVKPTADLIVEIKHGTWEKATEWLVKAGASETRDFPRSLPGTMWVKFYSAKGAEAADYQARLRFEPVDVAGNIPAQAHDVGLLQRQVTFEDYVGHGDMVDYFKLRLERADAISIRLLELSGDANVELLAEDQTRLAASVNPRTQHEEIDYPNAKPGTYFVRVFSKDGNAATYKLMLALGAVDTAGNTFATPRELGVLDKATIAIREQLSATDQRDFFKLSVTKVSQMVVQVSQMTSDIRLRIYDSTNTPVASETRAGTAAKSLNTAQPAGEYFILVENASSANTPYYMTVEIRPVSPHCHSDLAYALTPDAGGFNTTVSDECGGRWARFKLDSVRHAKIALEITRSDKETGVWVKMFHLRAGARPPIEFGLLGVGRRQNVQQLEPGDYLVRLDRAKGTSADVRLAVVTSSAMFDPDPGGALVREFDDWIVRVDTTGSEKRCIAYTVAKSVSPNGWRSERPYLSLSLRHKVTGSISHGFDLMRFYDPKGPLRAVVRTRTGSGVAIPVSVETPDAPLIQTMDNCVGKPGRCVSIKGLQGLTSGLDLVLEGSTKENRATATVIYSLRGYQAAIKHAASLCDTHAIIRNLIK